MDGVLVDSEPIHMELEQQVFEFLGIDFTEAYHHTLVGMAPKDMWIKIKQDHNVSKEIDVLLQTEKRIKIETIIQRDIKSIDGIDSLLTLFKKSGFSLSVGSSSPKKLIEVFIDKMGIRHYFDYLVSSEDVQYGKPAPDIFLEVAHRYNLSPDNFLVIEDSKNGVKAAKSAGMKCIGFKNQNSGNQDLSEADYVIESFYDLDEQIIKRLTQ